MREPAHILALRASLAAAIADAKRLEFREDVGVSISAMASAHRMIRLRQQELIAALTQQIVRDAEAVAENLRRIEIIARDAMARGAA